MIYNYLCSRRYFNDPIINKSHHRLRLKIASWTLALSELVEADYYRKIGYAFIYEELWA